jgi:putative hemolysin
MLPTREPFDLRAALPFLEGDGWRGKLRGLLDEMLGLGRVRVNFRQAAEGNGEPFANALEAFGLQLVADGFEASVPTSGPVVVMANHPYGGADALSLGALCMARRRDTLLMANEMAAELPVLGESMLPLSILGAEGSSRKNALVLKRSLDHLRGGGLLAVFPSGEVASWKGSAVEEGSWSPHIASLAMKTGAELVAVKFSGKTPAWFHLAGGIHPLVRTALLPRVLLAMRGETVRCKALRLDRASCEGMDAASAATTLRRTTLEIDAV